MGSIEMKRIMRRGVGSALLGLGLGALGWWVGADASAQTSGPPAAPAPAAGPQIADTKTNLEAAFDSEINARERYLAAAKIADREGYAYIASLFRACARAEQAHADQHVHAIAATGGSARALLQKMSFGSTPANLQVALSLEVYEAEQVYPAMLEKARAEHVSDAVRSITFALATEREHVRLLTAAAQTLNQKPVAKTFYICPGCGRTMESPEPGECPNCFTSARKFVKVT